MTSSLRRKLRTTRRSIGRRKWAEAGTAAVALFFLLGSSLPSGRADDALQKLRSRSSEQRWGRSAPTPDTAVPSRTNSSERAARISLSEVPKPPQNVAETPRSATSGLRRLRTAPSDVRTVSQSEERAAPAEQPLNAPSPPAAGRANAEPSELPEPMNGDSRQISSPSQLKRITAILPYQDYEPDPQIAKTDPCRNLCPRPGTCGPSEGQICPDEFWEPGAYMPRMFPPSCFAWAASNVWYNPLYFQDIQLERYGHTYCEPLQPFVSVGRFGVQLIALPYQMGIDPLCKKEYALGYYRPGDCAPKLCYQPPLSARGALYQAGVVTGLFFIIP